MSVLNTLKFEHCEFQDCSDGHSWGPGIQSKYTIHYIVNGAGYYETGGKKYRVEAGQSFFMNKNVKTYYYPDMKKPWSYIWVNFDGSEVKNIINMTAFFDVPVSPKADFNDIFNSFSKDIRSKSAELFNDGLLRMLLAKYIEIYPSQNENKSHNYIHIAKQYIAANCYRQDFTVNELASAVGIERSYLYRLFRENENMSVKEYIIDARLQNAKQMLDNGVKQIKVISYSTGYENPLYFSNAFKKKYGVSPKNYLNSVKH